MLNVVAALGGLRASLFAAASVSLLVVCGALWVKSASLKNQLNTALAATAAADVARVTEAAKLYKSHTEQLAEIAAAHERDLQNAKIIQNDVLSKLRNATIQLQDHWACAAPGDTSSASGKLNAAAGLREESAARIVQIGAEADAQVKRLQQVIEEYVRGRDDLRPGQK